jgi:hypothetical protein
VIPNHKRKISLAPPISERHFSKSLGNSYREYAPVKDTLFSPASVSTNSLIYDTHLSSYLHPDDRLVSSSSLALRSKPLVALVKFLINSLEEIFTCGSEIAAVKVVCRE